MGETGGSGGWKGERRRWGSGVGGGFGSDYGYRDVDGYEDRVVAGTTADEYVWV